MNDRNKTKLQFTKELQKMRERVADLEAAEAQCRQREKALLEGEARNRAILDAIPDFMFRVSKDGTFLEFIPAREERPALPPGQFLGKTVYEVLPATLPEEVMRHTKRALETGNLQVFEYRLPVPLPDGDVHDYEARILPCGNDEVLAIVRNITQQRKTEGALRDRTHELGERVKELNCLYRISDLVEKPGLSLEQIFQGTVGLIPPAWQYPEVTCARITLQGRTFKTNNFEETLWKLSSDIRVRGKPTGTLEVCYLDEKPQSDEGPFLKEERNLIDAIAERLGRISERKQAEKALGDSGALYHSLVENLPQNIFRKDLEGRFTFANGNFCASLRKHLAEIVGKTDADFYPAELANKYREDDKRVVETGKIFEDVEEHEIPDGRRLYVQVLKTPVYDSRGNIRGVQGIFWDVTARKRAEEAYRALVEHSLQGLVILRNARVVFANQAFADMSGYTVDEMLSMSPEEVQAFVHPEDRELVWSRHRDRLEGKPLPVRYEFRGIRKDGSVRWLEIHASLIEYQGQPAVQAAYIDITERKRAEQERNALARLGTRLAGAASVESVMAVVREESDRLLGWDAFYLAMRRPQEDSIRAVSFVDMVDGKKRVFDGEDLPAAEVTSHIREVLKEHPVLINRRKGDRSPRLIRFGNKRRTSASLMYVPVPSGNDVIGILSVQSYTRERYNESDLQLLQRLADVIAPALERAYAEKALRESEEKYRALVESSVDGIVTVQGTTITFANEAALKMHGCQSANQMVGHAFAEFVSLEYRELTVARGLARERGEDVPSSYEFRALRRDGTEFDAELSVSVITYEGVVARQAIVRDITERKKAEQENRRLQEQLAQAQKMQALGTLAGGIAHEFNNIIAAISGYTDLTLQAEELSASARRNLEIVRRSATRAADVTRSLLTFSRRDIGEKKPLNLKDVVDEVLRVTEKQLTTQGIEVIAGHSTNTPPIMGNAGLLEQVVLNLVINATHAMLKSPVRKLIIETGLEKGKPFIRVQDSGCGIPEDQVPRLFDPFFTTKGSLAAGEVYDGKARGTGLGLSVSHTIVKSHGGDISVRSKVGQGTTFTIYFPAGSKRETPPSHVETEKKTDVSPILVVDDEEPIADLIVDILLHAGYAAEGFTNPKEAMKAISQKEYSLCFVDLQMPGMKGEDFISAINRLPLDRRPLKIVLTGRLDVSEEHYDNLGVFATLHKPLGMQQILEVVESALAKRTPPSGVSGNGSAGD